MKHRTSKSLVICNRHIVLAYLLTEWCVCLQEIATSKNNYFQVDTKLEAVDRKNLQLLHPSTVGAVNRDQIHVMFERWKRTTDGATTLAICSRPHRVLGPVTISSL